MRELTAVGTFALCNLIFMVRKDEILAARVNVDSLAQMLARHGAALNMPAGAAGAVGAVPIGLAGLCRLPHGKICRVLLQIVLQCMAQAAVTAFQLIQIQVRELAIFLKLARTEINIAVFGHIAVAFPDNIRHDGEYLFNMLGGARTHGGRQHIQALAVLQEFRLIAAGHLLHGDALLVGLCDELVVNVCDV